MSEEMSVYRVKVDANWLPYEATFDCERLTSVVDKFQYPQVYRDDIPEGHDDWETRYEGRLHELIGKPVELYVVAVDELGAFVKATEVLKKEQDNGQQDNL
jgi:hypothetical protein